jgi:hypothetical protein
MHFAPVLQNHPKKSAKKTLTAIAFAIVHLSSGGRNQFTYLMIAIAYIIRSISPGSIAAVSGNPALFFTKPFQRFIIHNSSRGKESIQFGEEQKNRRNGGEKVGRET